MANTSKDPNAAQKDTWPSLPLEAWRETYATLHLWTQVVGKVRMALAPAINHWWNVALYVTSRGLTTSPIPYGARSFQIDFDFIEHRLVFGTSDGAVRTMPLAPRPVAEFYDEVMKTLHDLDFEVRIWTMPVEVENPVKFEKDFGHAAYDREYAHRFWKILTHTDRILTRFRSRFTGKCSPVHFFWGSFDMAVTRFSGRTAPKHPGGVPGLADFVVVEAYSHEVSSCGFWPGGGPVQQPVYYAYVYPEPAGFKDHRVRPKEAFYIPEMREFILPYEGVRKAENPDETLLNFLQSTYEAAADLGKWNRSELER